MMLSKEVKVSVNYMPVQIGEFVQRFIESVIKGILNSLKGYGEERNVSLLINNDIVEITVGKDTLQLNPFVSIFVKNTVIGMVSSLKDVKQIERLEINIS
ncbi:MAG: hypothetical protein JSV32_03440 [Dehalococcoidia bacterium]|nr:MAG: hypothetical protein JSV32_03440 [Dehalococcoidia bacterium]